GCHGGGGGGVGAVHGRILGVNGQPATGVRVMLDKTSGTSVLSAASGEFHLGANAGAHHVLAHSTQISAAASVAVSVSAGADIEIGDVVLEDCNVVMAANQPGGSGSGSGGTSNDPPPGDPTGGVSSG